MAKKNSYDVIVIGSGSAGFSAVEAAASLGARVCVVEKGRFGGECPNVACVPSKAILKAASVYRHFGDIRRYGLEISGSSFNWANIMRYRRKVVSAITGGGDYGDRYLKILKDLKVDHRKGKAVFVDEHTIEVAGETLKGKAIVIATGTQSFIPPISGLDQVPYWGWKEAIASDKQPKSMAIIGAGPVGCEIATFYASFGTRVVLLQAPAAILHREDMEISIRARQALERLGIDVVTDAKVVEVVNGSVGVLGLNVEYKGTFHMYAVEQVAIATGKKSNVAGLNLDAANVAIDKHGVLKTNKQQRTNVTHIFGAGDVDGGLRFTHTAHHEGWIAGHNAALKALRKRSKPLASDERVVPRATFIDPEVASVGKTEAEARMEHEKLVIGRYEIQRLGRGLTDQALPGLIKLIAHPKTRKLIGAHIIAARAGELIHEAALAMYLGATIDKLGDMIHAFPTYSEGLKAAASLAKVQ